jgi:hypothetical protein
MRANARTSPALRRNPSGEKLMFSPGFDLAAMAEAEQGLFLFNATKK